MFDLNGKTALVTGGSRGIGSAVAEVLARQGARVILTYVRDAEAAQRTVQRIEAAGGRAEAEKLDTASYAQCEATVSALAKRMGALDILVANAGIAIDGLLLRLREPDLDSVLNVNLKGALACAQAAIKPMMKARAGRIIFVSSVVGQMGNAGQVAYAASKAALIGAAKSLAREYASRNITVNALAPGYVGAAGSHAGWRAPRAPSDRGRSCRGHRFPRFRRSRLHHRSGFGCQRRHVHVRAHFLFT